MQQHATTRAEHRAPRWLSEGPSPLPLGRLDLASPVPSPPAPKPELLGSTICVLLTWPRTWQTLGGPKCFKGMSSQIISNFYLCSLDSTILSFHLSSIINHKHNRQIYAFDSNYLRESERQLQTQ